MNLNIIIANNAKQMMGFEGNMQEKIARRRAIGARFALAGEADDRTVAYARRNVDFERSEAMNAPSSPTTRTYLIVLSPVAAAVGANLVALQRKLACHAAMRFFKRERNFGFDIRSTSGKAGSAPARMSPAPASKKGLEEIAEFIHAVTGSITIS